MDLQSGTEGVVLTIDASDFFSSIEILNTEVTDLIYICKGCAKDLDEDAVITKTLTDGIELTNANLYTVSFDSTDYEEGKLEIGNTYFVFVGIKTNNLSLYKEAVMEDNILTITQDGIRG